MILANKNGWLSVVEVLKETEEYYQLRNVDEPNSEGIKWKLSKKDTSRRLFDNICDAEEWIRGG